MLSYDAHISNANLCKMCGIRASKQETKEPLCSVCKSFKTLGEALAKPSQQDLSSTKLGIDIDGFSTTFTLDERLRSYVLSHNEQVRDFDYLANRSCKDQDAGLKALAYLKADIDGMGNFIQNSDVTDNFANFDTFSQGVDDFFSLYVPSLMQKEFPNTYTIFAGGDDLFIVGAWDESLALARKIRSEFQTFIKGKLSISFGIALAKSSQPISFLAGFTQNLLEQSKAIDEQKDALSIFNETIKWDNYLQTFSALTKEFKDFPQTDETASFLYRLLELVEMAKNAKLSGDAKSKIWRSKLNYTFYKNLDAHKHGKLLDALSAQFEQNPQETKVFFCEYIYKRRSAR